jgi:hypothetical protein
VAQPRRRLDGEDGQVAVGEMLLVSPSCYSDHHRPEMASARVGAHADRRLLAVSGHIQACLKTRLEMTFRIGLASI